ncbi:LRIF1 factor, partial [Thryothorus ludovicianus]|nr:LRIF1 factor [Thryothorus ludovicianus]
SIAGCMYRVVQTTRPDGKNLLRLLPISKTSVPIVQSPDMPNNSNTNVSSSVHLTFKTQLGNTAAPSSVKIPIFQPPDPGKIVLTRTLDKQESDRVGSEKESLIPSAAANAQSSSVPIDGVSLQNAAITSSSHQSSTTYMVVNTKSLPVTVKSPVPSGHHLQIPADAEVKSVPASLLPPAIQQKILAAAATNVSGGVDSTKTPTVIYVSPVNTVKTSQVLPKHLQSFYPKPATEVSKTLIVTAAQKGSDSSPEPFTSEGQQCQQTPMKWIVQEAAPLSAPCLIPVKSSNNVASKILKTLSCTKNVDVNPANILPLCSSGPGGSHTKITPLKDNALVMYNGKVYLLTKRGSDVLSAQADKQMSSFSDASLKKEAPKQIDSTEVNKITSEVVNLVLKSKGVVLSQKDPKPCAVSKNSSPIGLRNDLKSTPAALLTPSANQQDPTVIQRQSLPFTRSISCSGVIEVPAVGMQESVWQNGKDMSHSPRAAGTVLPQAKQECAVSEDWPKIQCEKMDSLGKVIQIKHHEHTHWRQYLELRKKFGLFKEERVYLRRIPLRVFCENPEERICSNDSVERKNDSCGSSSLDMEIMSHHQECVKEEKIIVDLEEDLMRKRKIRSSPLSDTVKRKRTLIKSATIPSSEMNSSRSSALNRSVSPLLDSPQPGVPTGSVGVSQGRDSEQDTFPWYSDTTHPGISVLVTSEEDTSVLEEPFQDDAFPVAPPDLDETIRDEKIKRLKQLLREREAALEEMRRE